MKSTARLLAAVGSGGGGGGGGGESSRRVLRRGRKFEELKLGILFVETRFVFLACVLS